MGMYFGYSCPEQLLTDLDVNLLHKLPTPPLPAGAYIAPLAARRGGM